MYFSEITSSTCAQRAEFCSLHSPGRHSLLKRVRCFSLVLPCRGIAGLAPDGQVPRCRGRHCRFCERVLRVDSLLVVVSRTLVFTTVSAQPYARVDGIMLIVHVLFRSTLCVCSRGHLFAYSKFTPITRVFDFRSNISKADYGRPTLAAEHTGGSEDTVFIVESWRPPYGAASAGKTRWVLGIITWVTSPKGALYNDNQQQGSPFKIAHHQHRPHQCLTYNY